MVQGHMAVPEETVRTGKTYDMNYVIEYNLLKELEEEICLKENDITNIDLLYLVQSNDNKISSEHMGVISVVYIDSSKLKEDLKSGEPEKHDVVKLTMDDILDPNVLNKMDTWLKKVILQMKEEIMN